MANPSNLMQRCDSVSPALQRAIAWFETLTPETLPNIDRVYSRDAHFKDPFNDVTGIEKVHAIYAHMFQNLIDPRFEITEVIEQADKAFVAWQFRFKWRGKAFDIPGGTRFVLNESGHVCEHIDYWDVAGGLYEHLPLLGPLLSALRRRMSAT